MKRVYLDNNSTTCTDPRVVEAMLPYFSCEHGNPSSAHSFGWEAEAAVESARQEVASLIGADPDEVFFTSGATESNNWFLRCFDVEKRSELLASPTEHKSVLESVRESGSPFRFLPIDDVGSVRFDSWKTPIPANRAIVTAMAVNNEIHTILDVAAAVDYCRRHKAVFHCDGAQAAGRIHLDVHAMGIDALSISGHKIYGPKGVGALYVRRCLQSMLRPLIVGGGQEHSLRSGTVAVPLVVGLGKASEISRTNLLTEAKRLHGLAKLFLDTLVSANVKFRMIGPPDLLHRQPGSLCLEIDGFAASKFCELLPDIAISQGSACNSSGQQSHVFQAVGISADNNRRSIRLSFGRFNTNEEARYAAGRLAEVTKSALITEGRR